jgi:hypothetical protein
MLLTCGAASFLVNWLAPTTREVGFMRYTVVRSEIKVIGYIWLPNVLAAQTIKLSEYDLGNIEEPVTRDSVESWLAKHAGDFQTIVDFEADLEFSEGRVQIPWRDGLESECIYNDATFEE